MKTILQQLVFFFALIIPSFCFGQTLNINTAKLNWSWSQGTGPLADGFIAKCGTATGIYTRSFSYPGSTVRSAQVKDTVNANGKWFCVVTAYVQPTGSTPLESGPTNEVSSFFAGVAADPTTANFSSQ